MSTQVCKYHPAFGLVSSSLFIFFIVGCNPKQKNLDEFTPRLLAKERSFKEASKELRKAERNFAKYSKPGMKNPNEPEVLFLYDWSCERAAFIRELLMKAVRYRVICFVAQFEDEKFMLVFSS